MEISNGALGNLPTRLSRTGRAGPRMGSFPRAPLNGVTARRTPAPSQAAARTQSGSGRETRPWARPEPACSAASRLPAPRCDPSHDIRIARDDRDRNIVTRTLPADHRCRLVVANRNDHEVVVAERLHERDEGAHRVLDRLAVGGLGHLRITHDLVG